jgi:hypothetical protein
MSRAGTRLACACALTVNGAGVFCTTRHALHAILCKFSHVHRHRHGSGLGREKKATVNNVPESDAGDSSVAHKETTPTLCSLEPS